VHEKACDGEHGHDYDEEEDGGSEFAQDEGLAFVWSSNTFPIDAAPSEQPARWLAP
jgi:hypothetical protein